MFDNISWNEISKSTNIDPCGTPYLSLIHSDQWSAKCWLLFYHVTMYKLPHKPLSMTGTNMQICAWSNFKEFVEAITTFFITICTNILWFIQCPGGAFTPDIQTTKEFPDDVVTFVRNHPVMFNPIYPVGRRPLVVRTNADYKYTSVAVDQVMAADGNYQVLFLGTGMDVDRYRRQKY